MLATLASSPPPHLFPASHYTGDAIRIHPMNIKGEKFTVFDFVDYVIPRLRSRPSRLRHPERGGNVERSREIQHELSEIRRFVVVGFAVRYLTANPEMDPAVRMKKTKCREKKVLLYLRGKRSTFAI